MGPIGTLMSLLELYYYSNNPVDQRTPLETYLASQDNKILMVMKWPPIIVEEAVMYTCNIRKQPGTLILAKKRSVVLSLNFSQINFYR